MDHLLYLTGFGYSVYSKSLGFKWSFSQFPDASFLALLHLIMMERFSNHTHFLAQEQSGRAQDDDIVAEPGGNHDGIFAQGR